MMFSKLFFFLVATITLIHGLAIPESEVNALQLIHREDNSNFANQTTATELDRIEYCGCGFGVNHGNLDAAFWNLYAQLKSRWENRYPLPARQNVYAIVGDVVAFVCNGNAQILPDPEDYRVSIQEKVAWKCGAYIAGTQRVSYFIPPILVDHFDYGFMRYTPGMDWCGTAVTSPAHCCSLTGHC